MTDYLVAISVGPVQSLIEAGRRAQDLWCGSWLLSQAARAVAEYLDKRDDASLIFPVLEDVKEGAEASQANIANVVRAKVSVASPEALQEIIKHAKGAANSQVRGIFDKTLSELAGLLNHERWVKQQDDVLETFAAWVAFTESDYQAKSERLGLLLQARKQTRNFAPMQDNEDGWFKSSLDGAGNSVLHQAKKPQRLDPMKDKTLIHTLGLSADEDLDALGVVKRKAGEAEQFTPFSRIVAHSWLEKLSDQDREELIGLYQPLADAGLVTPVKGNDGCYQNFPYDGEYLFRSRIERADIDSTAKSDLLDFLAQRSAPASYGVLLKADGDQMGTLLKQAKTPEESRAISRALHGFAKAVRGIVREYGGHAVYTGGDDLLAFLPLNGAVDCAQELASTFENGMQAQAIALKVDCPTLSVGMAIGHFVQPMRQLRQRAIAAEHHAKGNGTDQPRNALAIHLGIRSGHELTWRCRWDDQQTLDDLKSLIQAFSTSALPSRIMSDVRAMARRLEWAKDQPGIQQSEFERMLIRAMETGGHSKISSTTKDLLRQLSHTHSLNELADLLVIARWLSAKTASDIQGND